MRCTQPMGLPRTAEAFLKQHAIPKDLCEHCGRSDGYVRTEVGRVGMFEDLPLQSYMLKDGRFANECVQAEHWSSGPMIWLALVVDGEEVYQWPESEIEKIVHDET